MAERVTRKGKRQPASRQRRSGRSAPDSKPADGRQSSARQDANGRLAALEREREQMHAQIADLKAQVARLEQARDEAVNRIDWAIDSLHNVLESDA